MLGMDWIHQRNKGSRTQPHISQAYHSLSSVGMPCINCGSVSLIKKDLEKRLFEVVKLNDANKKLEYENERLKKENEKLKEHIKTLERENRITLGAWKYEVEKLKKLEEKIKDIKEFLEVCDKLPSGMFKHYETRQIATRFEDDEDEDA